MKIRVIIEYDEETDSFAAYCPELPGCASAGDTEEEAIENIKEAILLYLEPFPHGFALVSQRGSHQKWRNDKTGKQVIVPYHKGKRLPIGTLKAIIEGSGISPDEFS